MEARFMSYVEKTDTCWLWKGGRNKGGYAAFNFDGRMHSGHRVAHELWNAEILDGLVVRHKCKNKHCVNPAHLETGTHKDNSCDMIRDGTLPKAKLTIEQVRDIRSRTNQDVREIATQFGVCPSTIWSILSHKTWCDVE